MTHNPLEPDEQRVIDIFAGHGFVLHKIPEANYKTPDFQSHWDGKLIMFELKTRSGDGELSASKETILEAGEVYAHGDKRNIETGNKKAANDSIQLSLQQFEGGRKSMDADYAFIILQLRDIHPDLTEDRWVKALHGIGDVFYMSGSGETRMGTCLSLHPSSFYTHRHELDGVFIVRDAVRFLPNPHSPNFIGLSKGKIFQTFDIANPRYTFELPASPIARSEDENRRILEEKYGIRVFSLQDWNRDLISVRSSNAAD